MTKKLALDFGSMPQGYFSVKQGIPHKKWQNGCLTLSKGGVKVNLNFRKWYMAFFGSMASLGSRGNLRSD